MTRVLTDLDFESEATAKNLADPVDAGDAVAIKYYNDFLNPMFDTVATLQTKTILLGNQAINFTKLTLDGVLVLEGDLWLA